MLLRQLFENSGSPKTAVLGWGRGMGHKGHMLLAKAVLHHAKENSAKPFFVVSRTSLVDPSTGQPWADKPTFTKTKDDPLTPDEKLNTYRKVFPQNAEVFSVATADATRLEQVLTKIAQEGFKKVILVVGEDQKDGMSFLTKPTKTGELPYKTAGLDELEIISRQDTTEPSSMRGSPQYQEGPRATPMRQVLTDPSKSEEEQFAVWRRDMPDDLSDEEVLDLMLKAKQRMMAVPAAKRGVKERMLPPSTFAGYPKNKLGPAAHLKGKMKRPARAGDLVGDAQESIEEGWKSKLAGLGLAAAAAMTPGKSDARVNIDDPDSYRAPTPIVQQQKIDYTKPGPVSKDSMGQKLEYGIPVTPDGKFKAPSQDLPDDEYSEQLKAYKKWKSDFMSRWPEAVWNSDGSAKSNHKPGLAPMTPGYKPGGGQGLAPVFPGAVKEGKIIPLDENIEKIYHSLIQNIIINETK